MKQQLADLFLEYKNDYLTTAKFAYDHGISEQAAKEIIKAGRDHHNRMVEIRKSAKNGYPINK